MPRTCGPSISWCSMAVVSSGTTPIGWATATDSSRACREHRSSASCRSGAAAPARRPPTRSCHAARPARPVRCRRRPRGGPRRAHARPLPGADHRDASPRRPSRGDRARDRGRPRDADGDAPPPGGRLRPRSAPGRARGCRTSCTGRSRPSSSGRRPSAAIRCSTAAGWPSVRHTLVSRSSRARRPIVTGWSGTSVRSSVPRSGPALEGTLDERSAERCPRQRDDRPCGADPGRHPRRRHRRIRGERLRGGTGRRDRRADAHHEADDLLLLRLEGGSLSGRPGARVRADPPGRARHPDRGAVAG